MWVVVVFVLFIYLIFGESEIFYLGFWCFIDVLSEDFGSSVSVLVYLFIGILIFIYIVFLYLYIMCRLYRDLEFCGYFVDIDRIMGYYDIYVNIFLMMFLIFYVLCWGLFLVSIL